MSDGESYFLDDNGNACMNLTVALMKDEMQFRVTHLCSETKTGFSMKLKPVYANGSCSSVRVGRLDRISPVTCLLTCCRESSKVKEMKRSKKESSDRHKAESPSPHVNMMVCCSCSLIHLRKLVAWHSG